MSRAPLVMIRTVAGPAHGLGHLTRCLSLARALLDRGAAVAVALLEPPEAIAAMVADAGVELIPLGWPGGEPGDPDDLARLCRVRGAAALVIDGYVFDAAHIDRLAAGLPTLWIDDLQEERPSPALILNQNLYAEPEDYPPGPRLLLGPRFCLLRPDFLAVRPPEARSQASVASRLLITFGGSDPNGLTARALAGLAGSAGSYHIKVVGGTLGPHAGRVAELAEASPHRVEVLGAVRDMTRPLLWAELALAGTGVTGYEMACLGLPLLAVTPVANQRRVSEAMARAGLCRHLGWWEDVDGPALAEAVDDLAGDREARERLSRAGMATIDGRGAMRAAAALMEAAA